MEVSKVTAKNRWNGNQRRIGITGGIASGKSSITRYLSDSKKIPILDADIFAREALMHKTKITNQIIERYGAKVITDKTDKKTIERLALGKIIFANKKERLWVENLIHPYVTKRFDEELKKLHTSPILALVIPLLFEAKLTHICSEIWCIYCTKEQQYNRLNHRNYFSYKESKLRIESQLPMEYKMQMSDQTIDNSANSKLSYDQIDKLLC